MKQHAPAAARNREPIREVLATCVPERGLVLEIASGTGEHAVHMARAFPTLEWQPSDRDTAALASIAAWRAEAQLPNLLAPVELDVTSDAWPVPRADVIVCINMIHIAPWDATLGLFAGGARTLPAGGAIVTYGPYRIAGVLEPESNVAFDCSLRSRDARWGIRDTRELDEVATAHGFALERLVAMPANNHTLVFRKTATP